MRRILVVDDEPAYRSSIERLLAGHGFEVRTAAGCEDGLAVAESFAPEILVVDWMLRQSISGGELAQKVRQRLPDIVTIVMSGFPSSALESDGKHGAIAAFLEKPFDPEDLIDAIAAACPDRTE